MGFAVGLTATLGARPRLRPRELVVPMTLLVCAVAVATALTGVSVWRHSEMLEVSLAPDMAEVVPVKRHRALLTVACYPLVAYASSAIGGVALCAWVSLERRKRWNGEQAACPPDSSA